MSFLLVFNCNRLMRITVNDEFNDEFGVWRLVSGVWCLVFGVRLLIEIYERRVEFKIILTVRANKKKYRFSNLLCNNGTCKANSANLGLSLYYQGKSQVICILRKFI